MSFRTMSALKTLPKKVWEVCLITCILVISLPTFSYSQGGEPVNVSEYVTVTTANVRTTMDRRTRVITSTADVTITNSSNETLSSPLHAVIEILATSYDNVQMPEALGGPGTDPYEKYYYDLTGSLSDGRLSPGESVTFTVKFVRSSVVRFTYNVLAYGVLASAPENHPPTAAPGGPYSGVTGQEIAFDGSGSTDPDNDPLTFEWDFGDGATAIGATPTHPYAGAGDCVVTLTVNDGRGGTDTAQTQATVADVNHPPSLEPITEQTVDEGQTLTFEVIGSDPDDDPLSYTLSQLPPGADFDQNNQTFSWTPTYDQASSYMVTFTVTDSGGLSYSIDVSITVINVNRLPQISSIPITNATEEEPYSYDVEATDPDAGDVLTFSLDVSPGGMTIDPATGVITWTPATAGSFDVTVAVDDGNSGTDTQSFTIVVAEAPNRPPSADAGGPYSGFVGQEISFDGSGSTDPDNDPLSFGWDFGDGMTATVETPTHSYSDPGDYTVTLIVNDPEGATDTAQTQATIADINHPPSLSPVDNQTIDEGQLLTFQVTGTDPDGDDLTYSAHNLPAGPLFDPPTRTFSWTPTYDQAGSYTVTFTVADTGGLPGSIDVTITVKNVNRAPLLDPVSDRSIAETKPLTFRVIGSDPDGDDLAYSSGNLPADAAFDAVSRTFSWAPASGYAGTYQIGFTVSDGFLTDSIYVRIFVAHFDTNNSPSLTPVPDQEVNEGQTLTFQVTGSDPHGDPLTFDVNGLPSGAAFESTADPNVFNFAWTPGYDQAGDYTVNFTVSDPGGLSDTINVDIIVNNVNRPPSLDPVTDRSIAETKPLTFQLTGSDPDGDELTYSADNLPEGGMFDPVAQDFSWTPTDEQAGEYDISFSVSDGDLTDSIVVHITVIDFNVNSSPSLSPVDDQEIDEGQMLTFELSASDPNDDILEYNYSGLAPDAGFSDNGDGTAAFTWTPDFDQAGLYTVNFTVSDPDGLSDTMDVNIRVNNVNRPPSLDPVSDQSVDEGTELTFQLNGSDPDNDPITYGAPNLPEGAAFVPEIGAFSWTPTFDQAGSYEVTFFVSDGELSAERQALIEVIDVNRAPSIITDTIPDGQVDQIYKAQIVAEDPDGDSIEYSIETTAPVTIDVATGQLSWDKPSISDIGTYSLTVQVVDNRGGSDTRQYTLSVPDTIPPAIVMNAPKQGNPGGTFSAEASVSDNDAVVAVEVYGDRTDFSSPYQKTITQQKKITLPSELGTVTVHAFAWDPSGNKGEAIASVEVVATFDTTPPQITLNAPSHVTQGQVILLTASVSDDVGVSTVTFSAEGTDIGTTPAQHPFIEYQIPASAVIDSTIQFRATAVDFSGNSASDEASSTLVGSGEEDTTPPASELQTPETVTEDDTIPITVQTPNETCLARIDVYVNHTLVATYFAPEGVDFDVPMPDGVEGGMNVLVEVVVTDCSGNQTTTSDWINVEEPGKGVVAGEVYNDSTGLPLTDAEVAFVGEDGSTVSAITDARGQYNFVAKAGTGRLTITKDGFTVVERTGVAVPESGGLEAFDVRLTPLGDASPTVSAALGAGMSIPFSVITAGFVPALEGMGIDTSSIESTDIGLDIPAGALTQNQAFTLTQISPQGLAGLLPGGWSPVGVIDISPHAISFQTPASLAVPNPLGFDSSARIILATWDETEHAWRVIFDASLSSDGTSISAEVTSTGQFAFIVSDLLPEPPPDAVAGELLGGITPALIPDPVTTVISPEPKIIFYRPGVHSDVGVSVSAGSGQLTSGAPVLVNIAEEYNFYSGDTIVSAPYVQDIVLYSLNRPDLTAAFPVTPSYTFEALTLDHGVINVDVLAPTDVERGINVITPEGGTVALSTGEAVTLPEGAASDIVPVDLEALTEDSLGIELPPELSFVGGVFVSFSGNEFDEPVGLSVPVPSDFDEEQGQLLLVQLLEVQGATRMVLVGVGEVRDSNIVALYSLPGSDDILLEGILSEGRYIFVQMQTGIGFVAGTVFDTAGAPLEGTIVSANDMPVIAISRMDGSYAVSVNTGAFSVTALDPEKMDSGTATGTITQDGELVQLDLFLVQEPPHVVSFSPVDGQENVPLETAVKVTFSEPLDAQTVIPENLILTGPEGPVSGNLILTSSNTQVTFRPAEPLTSNTTYTFTASQGIRDLAGYNLETPFIFSFTSLDTIPPPPPPAGNIAATIPDETGKTTITTTQGTAGPHDTVIVINKTQGISTPALVEPDGSFTVNIDAEIIDEIVISITDPAGNETVVPVGRFENPDGSAVIGPDGGFLEADNGVILDIPAGAFTNGAVVKITALTREDLGIPDWSDWPFVRGFELSCSEQPQVYLNVSVPLPDGKGPDAHGVIAELAQAYGQNALSAVDTLKVIDGRLATSSPPCPGIFSKFAQYAMFLNEDEQYALGEAILFMVPPIDYTVQVYMKMEHTPSMSDILFPFGLVLPLCFGVTDTVTEYYYPAHPFINKLSQGESVWNVMGAAENACLPLPADKPVVVVLRDIDTGEVAQTIPLSEIAAGQSMNITDLFFVANDLVPPVVVLSSWSPIAPYTMGSGKPIELRFSESVMLQGDYPVRIMDAVTGNIIFGECTLTQRNRVVIFSADETLKAGHSYEILLPGVRDLAGNAYAEPPEGPLTFSIFQPYVLSLLEKEKVASDLRVNESELNRDNDFGFKDIDFSTKHPAENPENRWNTYLTAVRDDTGAGKRIFTIDVSNPGEPVVLGAAGDDVSMWYEFDRAQLLDDFFLEPRDSLYADPQFWTNRELHYVVQDPSVKICGEPGSTEIQQWQETNCWPMYGYWSGVFYEEIERQTSGYGVSIFVDFDGLNANVRISFAPELIGHTVFLAYNNDVRSFVVPHPASNPHGQFVSPLDWSSLNNAGIEPGWTSPAGYTGEVNQANHLDKTDYVLIENVECEVKTGGCGDLLITTMHRIENSYLYGYDVTDKNNPFSMIFRMLSEDRGFGVSYSTTNWWAPAGIGYPRNFTLFNHMDITHSPDIFPGSWVGDDSMVNEDTLGAFIAVDNIGLELVDIGLNFPSINEAERRPTVDPLPGTRLEHYESLGRNANFFYNDIAVAGGRVIAIAGSGTAIRTLEIFTPSLEGPLYPPLFLQHTPVKMQTCQGYIASDRTGDGTPDPYDIAFVLGQEGGMSVVILYPEERSPEQIGYYCMPEGTFMWKNDNIEIDTSRKLAYVSASWAGDFPGQGILVIDISKPFLYSLDEDQDGWDDRIIGKVKIIGTTEIPTGILHGFRYDPDRGLIYAAMRAKGSSMQEYCLATVATQLPSEEIDISLNSASIDAGQGDRVYESTDGQTSILYIDTIPLTGGEVTLNLDLDTSGAISFQYQVSETPISGDPADAMLDLSGGNASGIFTFDDPSIDLSILPTDTLPMGSSVYVDVFDDNGNFIKRFLLLITPAHVDSENIRLKTTVDRINGGMCGSPAKLTFTLTHEAQVTIRVDGQIVEQTMGGQSIVIEDLLLPAGDNQITITRDMVPGPGEHEFRITAVFRDNDPQIVSTFEGTIVHDVVINGFLPVGHSFIKGVDLFDGHLSIMRQDILIKGLGPNLEFTRSYGSVGSAGEGPMGAGWTHNYNAKIVFDSCQRVTLIGGEGSGTRFSNPVEDVDDEGNPIARYQPQAGYHGRLISYDFRAFDYFNKEGTRYRYEIVPDSYAEREYRLMYIEDTFGNRLSLTYDENSPYNLQQVQDASGRTLEISYASYGTVPEDRIEEVTGPAGLRVEYTYDTYGNLTGATRSVRTETYEYTADQSADRHNLVRVTSPIGNITSYTYYSDQDTISGYPVEYTWSENVLIFPEKHELIRNITEGLGQPEAETTRFVYDHSNHQDHILTTVTNSWQVTTHYTMNPRGSEVEKRVVMAGGDNVTRSRWAYEDGIPDVYLTQKTDPNGRVTNLAYDANGNLIREDINLTTVSGYEPIMDEDIVMDHVIVQHTYDQTYNIPLHTVDVMGNVMDTSIDPDTGAILSNTYYADDGTPVVTTYTYYDNGELHSETDANGNVTTYTDYDVYGNWTRKVDAVGIEWIMTYDERSRLIDSSDSMGHRKQIFYDDLDNIISTVQYTGTISPDVGYVHTYYPDGKKHTQTDGLSHTTEFFYDALGRLIRQVETLSDAQGNPLSYEWTYAIDPGLRTKTETNPRGVSKVTRFDELVRIIDETLQGPYGPKQVIAAYTYDLCGNRITETAHTGAVTTYVYDGLYRMSRKILPISSASETYEEVKLFDAAGNLSWETDANGNQAVYSYDSLYRMTTKTDPVGNEIQYSYDNNGNIIEKTYVNRNLVTTSTYDAINRPLSTTQTFTDPLGGGNVQYTSTLAYDNGNHTKTLTDPEGKVVREVYDGIDRAISRNVDPNGLNLVTTFSYDAGGNLTTTNDPEGRVVENVYDGLNRKISARYQPQGFEELFAYDGMDMLTRETDTRGIVMEYTYDNLGRMRQMMLHEDIIDPGTIRTIKEFVYEDTHADGPRMIETDALGNARTRTYDFLGRTISETDALGYTTSYEYDGVHRRAMVDQRGNRTEYAFDAIGRIVLETDAAGNARQTIYEDTLNRQTEIDKNGIQSRYQYDPLERLVQITNSLSAPDSFDIVSETNIYRGDNSLLERTDGNGNITRLEYDTAGRKIAEIHGFGTVQEARTTYTYDRADRIVSVKSARDHGGAYDYLYAYDDAAHTVTTTDGQGNVTTTTYDGDGNILAVNKAGGALESRSYDEIGKLLSVIDPLGNIWRYTYDANRNMTLQEDGQGNQVRFAYDALNNLTDTYQILDESTEYRRQQGYDEAGHLSFTIDPKGQRLDYAYDELNRVTNETYSNHVDPVMPYLVRIEYERDQVGNLVEVREVRSVADTGVPSVDERIDITVMTYDNMNRLSSKTNSDGKAVLYTYDASGNRDSVIDTQGETTTYSYDALNRIERLDAPLGSTGYTYYGDGLPDTVAYPNGSGMDVDYDRSGFVTNILQFAILPGDDGIIGTEDDEQTQLARYAYLYDARGNMSQQHIYGTDPSGDPLITTYECDPADRLSNVDYPGDGRMAYTYDSVGNRLTETGIDPADGATQISRILHYNTLNRLYRREDSIDPFNTANFDYDFNGNMILKTIGAQDTHYSYDIRNRLMSTTDLVHGGDVGFDYDYNGMRTKKTSSAEEIRYLYDDGSLLTEYGPAPAYNDVRTYTYGRELISVTDFQAGSASPSRVQYLLRDSLGSMTAFTNADGNTDATYRYDAWGNIMEQTGTTTVPVTYTGHYLDSETGLLYFGARYYDSSLGRFITQDPISGSIMNPPSLHRYLYAYANPMRYVDLDGYEGVEFMPILGEHWNGVKEGFETGADNFAGQATAQIADLGFWALKKCLTPSFRAMVKGHPDFQYKSQAGQALAMGVPISTVAWESLKGMAAAPVDFVASLTDMSVSPEERGELLFNTLSSIQSLGKPAIGIARKPVAFLNKTIKFAERRILTKRLLSRRRVGSRYVPGLKEPYVKTIGDFAPADAKLLAGEFMKHREVMISGGLTEIASPSYYRMNMKSNKSLGHLGYEAKPGKAAGDLDMHFSGMQPNRFRSKAAEINRKLTVDMIDQIHDVLPIGMTDEILGAGTIRGSAAIRLIKKNAGHLIKKGRVQSTYLRDGIPMSKGFAQSFSGGKVTSAGNYAAIFKNGEWILRPANKAFFIHRTLPEIYIPPLQTGVAVPAMGLWGAPAMAGGEDR